MKIILTTHQFLPDYSAGTEVLVYSVAKELQRKGHIVIVFSASPTKISMSDESRFDTYNYDGINVIRFWHSVSPIGEQSNLMALEYDNKFVGSYFKKVLSLERPDAVHFFHFSRLTPSLIDECTVKNIPCFFTPTDFWVACPLNQLLLPNGRLCSGPAFNAANCIQHFAAIKIPLFKKVLSRIPNLAFKYIIQLASYILGKHNPLMQLIHAVSRRQDIVISRINSINAIFVPNHFIAKILEQNGVSRSLMLHSPYGMDLSFKTPKRLPHPQNNLRIAFIGTISANKGLHLLIKAVRLLPELMIELKIYGDVNVYPDYTSKLISFVNQDTRIRFCGTFRNADIGSIFSGIDVLVVPSIWYENTPLVIYSAQSCGCPVIASNLGSIPEVIFHGKNGLLFPAGEITKIAAAISILDNDREMLKRLSENAISPRSISDYVSELLMHYQIKQNADHSEKFHQTMD